MSKEGLAFQQSKTTAFLQSIALERNLWSNRSAMSVGIGGAGSWTEYENASERAVHQFMTPAHVHSTQLSESIITGVPGFLGNDSIGGTGWARVYLRVFGVAHKIGTNNTTVVEGESNTKPIGSLLSISGAGIYSPGEITHTMTPADPGEPFPSAFVFKVKEVGWVGLNLFSEVTEPSDEPFAMDRIVSFSTQLPVLYSAIQPGLTWNQLVLTGESGFYRGGTQPAGYAPYTTAAALGIRIPPRPVCRNTLNTRNPLTGLPFFTDPTNTIQLIFQRVGFRPESGPRPVEYLDLN